MEGDQLGVARTHLLHCQVPGQGQSWQQRLQVSADHQGYALPGTNRLYEPCVIQQNVAGLNYLEFEDVV